MTTLIFPAVTQSALDYLEAARRRGEQVIAASSIYDAKIETAFGKLNLLPYIYDEKFPQQFLAFASSQGITRIYAPVASVHAFLETLIAKEKPGFHLVEGSPIRRQVEAYRKLRVKAQEARRFICDCADTRQSVISWFDVAAIFRQADTIYGESNDDKLTAMMAIFATAPKGDVIEIGSLMGKSVFVMEYLARHYQTGGVLSIDPLSAETSVQNDKASQALAVMDNQWDYTILREAFAINLLPFSGSFNYLRMESERGFEVYTREPKASSPHFGDVNYAGRIAVIHIDGNHDFHQVSKDCEQWLTRLVPGAWVILDDYIWSHGDGPYRVGNTLLEQRQKDIERAFVCGKALFIKFL